MARYEFGPFSFDPVTGLMRGGDPVPLSHRGSLLLGALLEADGGIVDKASLFERAWPGLTVEDGNLTVQIAGLRKALGNGPAGEWIVTVPRIGYRLPRPRAADAQPVESGLPVVAVLPFRNLGSDPEQDYFADGVTEDLIAALSRFRTFSVLGRSSIFALKGQDLDTLAAGRQLGVRYLLDGSVRRSGERVRVSAQLTDMRSGEQLWAERFDGVGTDVFTMQDRITEAVVGLVEPEIRKAEIERARHKRPDSLDAYDLYLRALPLVYGTDPAGYSAAIPLLGKASELDPCFALAIAFEAWAHEKRITLDMPSSGDEVGEAIRLAQRALALGADDPTVLAIAGWVLVATGEQWDLGLAAISKANAANPNDLVVLNLMGIANIVGGDIAEARAAYGRALALSPRAPDTYWSLAGLGLCHLHSGEYAPALEWGHKALAEFNDWPVTYWLVAAAAAHLGRTDEARAAVQRLRELVPHVSMARMASRRFRDPVRWSYLADGLRLAGLPES